MESYPDLPLVITEWGGRVGQGNPRVLAELCATFARHAREGPSARIAGSCFWVWQDYPEHTRAEPATIDGWTIEGLIDRQGTPRQDLLALSQMCFETDHPPVREAGQPRVLLRGTRRSGTWASADLERVTGDQAALEREIEQARAVHGVPAPVLGPVLVDGIEFTPRHAERPAAPLLIGRGREEVVIPVNRTVQAVAVLGHVDFRAGYPGSGLFSVHTGGALAARTFGQPASEYRFEFDDGTVAEPLRHGEHILRGNVICRWWRSDPRAPFTRGAIEAVLHPSYEILRIDLWEKRFERPRQHLGGGSAVRGGVRAWDKRRRHLGGGSAARGAGGAQDLRRQHPGAWQASGGGARHRYFRGEVGCRFWVPRHRTDATADTAGRPEHAHRAGNGGSWSQRSFASEAGTGGSWSRRSFASEAGSGRSRSRCSFASEAGRGGAARWAFAAAARGNRRVRGQCAAAAPGASVAVHSGTGEARGVAPRRRLLQLRRSAQRAPLRVPLPAGTRPHRSLCAWRQRRAGELEASLCSPPSFPASGVRTAARRGHVIGACRGRELGGWRRSEGNGGDDCSRLVA